MIVPDMGGKELIEELARDNRPARVIAMTGYELPEDIQVLGKEMSVQVPRIPSM